MLKKLLMYKRIKNNKKIIKCIYMMKLALIKV